MLHFDGLWIAQRARNIMGHEPTTYCRWCGGPFDVYTAIEDRICENCNTEKLERAELGVDGNCGSALVGSDLQIGEAEFEEIKTDEPLWSAEGVRQSKLAINRAFTRLKARMGKPISYYIGPSHPDHS
jgi:hypothetical protein